MNLGINKFFLNKKSFQSTVVVALLIIGSCLIAASAYHYNFPSSHDSDAPDSLETRTVKNNDSLYQAYSRKGDMLNSSKNYQQALDEYEKALKIRPNDAYVNEKVTRIKTLLTAQGKTSIEYTKAISSGDKYFKENDFLNAKSAYQVALDMRPDDPYAKGRFQETMNKLRSQKATNILYDVAIAGAEKLFQAKEYEKAMAEFENASKMLPSEKYPKDRINEIIKIMVDQKTKEEMYARSIAAADKFYAVKNFQNALLEYQNASSYKPDEQYPKDRINELTALLASLKATEEAYKKAIASADKFFNDAAYPEARAEYQNASKIKPKEVYPVNRIREIDDLLANLKRTKEQYERAIALADSLYIEKKYELARTNYQQALKVRPKEAYPKEMISKTERMMSDQDANFKQREEEYQAAIAKADGLVTEKSYGLAKTEYQRALTIKADEQYPKDRINEIDAILAGMDKQKSLDEQYKILIAGADKSLAEKAYAPAKADYQKALQIKPSEQYPKDKIAIIDAALAELAKLKDLEGQYAASIARADKLMASKSWELAKIEYGIASNLKPEETYPKEKIAAIDLVLADLAKQMLTDKNYQAVIANADKLLLAKSYIEAKTEYGKASDIKPAEQYPKTKMSEIDKLLALQSEQQQKEEQYTAFIARADKLLADKSYDVAKTEYQSASLLKPTEAYPKTKITEIDKILDDLGKQKLLEERYQAAITSGDRLLDEKSYAAAKTQYQTASSLKPAEQYPKDKIALIDVALADLSKQKALDDQYTASIAKADKWLTAKTWGAAKDEYTVAAGLKPGETYPKERIAEIEKVLADLAKQKATDENYQSLVVGADKLMLAKSYAEAKTEYLKAADLKPAEQYPKTKISEIDGILALLADQQQKEENYKLSLARADKLLAEKSYDVAKTEYQNASLLKPAEAYPKTKITEIDRILDDLGKQKLLEERYQAAITSGDKLLDEKSYSAAKTQYQTASSLKPAEQYPKDKIALIDVALADLSKQKALDDQYTASIAKADKLLSAKTWGAAKDEYTVAAGIKPGETYPKERIAEIEKVLADVAKQKATDDNYQSLIAGADKLLLAKSYTDAKTEYLKASDLKPTEQYPKTKITEIDGILALQAEQQQKEEQYKSSVARADKLLAEKSYDVAKTEYQNASLLKPAEAYPKTKITEIDKILADLGKQKLLEERYQAAITSGDKLLDEKSYAAAKTQYQTASSLKPAEQYPKDKITLIDAALAELAKLKALDDQYAASIGKADKLLAAKSWELAKAEYTIASGLKPAETYPKEKIAEIDNALADLAKQKAIEDGYKAAIATADKFLLAKSYTEAKGEYIKASSLKPAEEYPKSKITEIDRILALQAEQLKKDEDFKASVASADKLLAEKSYDPAKTEYLNASSIKPAEVYPKTKIAEIDKILAENARLKQAEEQYAATLAEADKLLLNKSYPEAKVKYNAALVIKPTEQYPKDKISEIDKTLADLAKTKALDDQYSASIAKADKLLSEKSYDLAKSEYTNSLKLKPAESYPKDKIAEIDKILADLLAQKAADEKYRQLIAKADNLLSLKSYDPAKTEYTNALAIKHAEQYPKDKIAEIDKTIAEIVRQNETESKYKISILKADQLLLSKSYELAKAEYIIAGSLKPADEYPKTKIADIEKILADRKAMDEQYTALIVKADQLLLQKSYDLARQEFMNAAKLKPAEQYPKDKLAEIEKALAELAKQKTIENQYQAILTKADKLFTEKSYLLAKTEYTNAGVIKPSEQYPKDKIVEIDGILTELKAKDEAYKTSIARANQLLAQKSYEDARSEYQNASSIKLNEQFPKDKISEINKLLTDIKGKKQTYDELIVKGNDYFGLKDYYKAKETYQQASLIFPTESYPKERLTRITTVIDSIYRANKGFYDKAIAEADKYYTSMIFDKAIDSYGEASSYLPMETYPREMISKIKKTIAENAIVDVLKTTVIIPKDADKQFPFTPVSMASRKNNYVYVKIRNLSDKPFNVLIRYGKDKQTNGGAVIKNLAGDGKTSDRLISVRDQDPWYREDNNWVSIYPQGGDVEVTFIQISRATQ